MAGGEAKKVGRPSGYTVELGERICQGLASGKSLRQVLLEQGMPSRSMVHRWADQYTEFRESLAQAQSDCADWHADRGVEVLNSAMGQPKEIVAAAREIARHHLSLAKVVDPRRYGDQARFEVEHSGSVQGMGAVCINITAAQAATVLAACAPVLDVQAEKPALPDDSGERVGRE